MTENSLCLTQQFYTLPFHKGICEEFPYDFDKHILTRVQQLYPSPLLEHLVQDQEVQTIHYIELRPLVQDIKCTFQLLTLEREREREREILV